MNPARTASAILSAAALLAFAPLGRGQENPSPVYVDYFAPPPPAPCCESCAAGGDSGTAASCADLPHCWWAGSVFFSVDLGRTPFVRDTDYSSLMKKPARELYLPGAAPPGFASTARFYQSSPLTGRRSFHLWYHQETITAASFSPAALVADPGANCEKIMLQGAVRQILTDDRFADVQELAAVRNTLPADIRAVIPAAAPGFVVRTWFAGQQNPKQDGLYGVPAAAPLAHAVFYRISLSGADGSLGIILRSAVGPATTKTESWVNQLASGAWTSTHYKDLPGGTALEEITRSPVNGNPLVQSHVVRHASISPDTGAYGDLATVSQSEEEFAIVGGLKRLVRRTEGTDLAEALHRTTRFGWIDSSANSATHGLLQWQSNPDGSFVHHTYNISAGANSGSVVTRSPWKGTSWNPGPTVPPDAGCVVETSTFDPSNLTVERKVGGTALVESETQSWTSAGGLLIHTRKVRYGAATADVLTTTTAYSATDGRIAWRKLPDGTAETYSYTGAVASGNYQQTVAVGADSPFGISSGTWTTTTRNQQGFATAEQVRHSADANTLVFESWIAEEPVDWAGRPTKRIWNDPDSGDFDQTEFGCCGIASFRDRDGITEAYSRDYLKRLYKTVRTAGASVVTTTTSFNGLVTETRRKAGSGEGALDVLVSKTTRLTNGETTQVAGPDQDNVNVSAGEVTSYSYSYPGGGRVVTVTHPDGGQETTTYLVDGRVSSVSGSAVAPVSYDYGTYTETGGGSGTTTTVTRPSTASPAGEWVKTYTDLAGRPVKVEYPTATPNIFVSASTSYFPAGDVELAGSWGKVASTTDPDGVTVSYTYNSEGNRASETRAMPGTAGNRVTATTHDVIADGMFGIRQTSTTVNEVPVSAVLVEDHGRTTRTILPDNDPNNDLNVTTTTRDVISTAGTWTETTTHPDGTRTYNIYQNGLLSSVEQRDNTSGLGTIVSSTSYQYDALDRLWKTTDSRTGDTVYSAYTAAGNPGTVTDPGGRATSYVYDKQGRTVTTTLPDDSAVHTSYTGQGLVKARWGAQTYPVLYEYDEQRRMIRMRTWRSNAPAGEPGAGQNDIDNSDSTTWSYHPQRGWLAAKEYPDGQDPGDARDPGPSYTHTAAGRLATRQWARNLPGTSTPVLTEYGYQAGMLRTVTYNDTLTPDLEYVYDAFGRVVTVKRGGATHATYTFDPVTLRPATETLNQDTFARTLHRYHDTYGRPLSLELKSSSATDYTTAYGHDNAGRLDRVWHLPALDATSHLPSGDPTFTYGYSYNQAQSSDPRVGNPNGTKQDFMPYTLTKPGSPAMQTNRTYEPTRDALVNIQNSVGGSAVSSYTYEVNEIGQRSGVTTAFNLGSLLSNPGETDWGYDSLGQVTSADAPGGIDHDRFYAFDSIGNRAKTRTGTHIDSNGTLTTYFGQTGQNPPTGANPLNQYARITTGTANIEPVHDADGNMTSGPVPGSAGANVGVPIPSLATLVWDAENRLVSATVGETTVTYDYDYLGRLVTRGQDNSYTHYHYDGWNRIAEYANSSSAPSRVYTWGLDLSGTLQGAGGVGGLLAIRLGTSANHYPTYDGNGNISEYRHQTIPGAHFEYDPFGNLTQASGLTNLFTYRFSTKPRDPVTGLYYYGFRYYDPLTGRWPSRDSIEEEAGMSLYAFVENGPVIHADYLGLYIIGPLPIPLEVLTRIAIETGRSGTVGGKPMPPPVTIQPRGPSYPRDIGSGRENPLPSPDRHYDPWDDPDLDHDALRRWIEDPNRPKSETAEDRRAKIDRCHQLYRKAKHYQTERESYRRACTCEELDNAMRGIRFERGYREQYLNEGCDDGIPWRGKPSEADHPQRIHDLNNEMKNALKSWQEHGCKDKLGTKDYYKSWCCPPNMA